MGVEAIAAVVPCGVAAWLDGWVLAGLDDIALRVKSAIDGCDRGTGQKSEWILGILEET
jgi:hypothetical protein